MNSFDIMFLDVVILVFPLLIYLIYLSTNKNINNKIKELYLNLALLTSFFLIYKYNFNTKEISFVIINSIIVLCFINDKYILSNFFSLTLIVINVKNFNNIFIFYLLYIILNLLYLIKDKIGNFIFLELYNFLFFNFYIVFIFVFNYNLFDLKKIISLLICYVFISNILYLIYESSKRILKSHIEYKELKKDNMVKMSLFKITHEIKNPIAVCKGYLDMLDVNNKDQVKRYIPIINNEIKRILNLLQDFLLINKKNMDFDILDINLLIEDVLSELSDLISTNNINLDVSLIDDEIYIYGDYNRLSQVLINILKNSIEAFDNKLNNKIKVVSKIINNHIYIFVEDNGQGIKKEILEKIKEPFFTTKKRGTGLGVSLCYEIIEAHKGDIEYTSKENIGTIVKIDLPIYCE